MSSILTPTPNQPTLPAEIKWTEAELVFMDESPPGLFPENQNSNFGFIFRKLFSDKTQEAIDWMFTLWNERFVSSSSQFLDAWEIDYGLPVAPTGISIEQRRASVVARVQRGPFTRARRDAIIRSFIETTFGTTVQLTEPGVPLSAGGTQLFGESADVETLYEVYEDQSNYLYEVWIVNTSSPDVAALTRELKRITPAGISFTFDNTRANIRDFGRTMRNYAPAGYWRMNNTSDTSGYGNNLTAQGGVSIGGGASLTLTPDKVNSTQFTAIGQQASIAVNTLFPNYAGPFTFFARVSFQAWPASGQYAYILSSTSHPVYLLVNENARVLFSMYHNGVQKVIQTTAPLVNSVFTTVAGVWDGVSQNLYIDGVKVATQNLGSGASALGAQARIGGGSIAHIGEVAWIDRAISDEDAWLLHRTAINQNP